MVAIELKCDWLPLLTVATNNQNKVFDDSNKEDLKSIQIEKTICLLYFVYFASQLQRDRLIKIEK